MQNIIKAAIFTPTSHGWGLPILFWGEPGVGKSAVIESLGHQMNVHVETLSPGERGEGAFGVIPVPNKHGTISYPAPDWVTSFNDEDGNHMPGILFVDEISTAPPALQPPLLGLVQAKRIGSTRLHPGVRVIGALNPASCAANGFDLAPPLANRFGHIDWVPSDATEWNSWLLGSTNPQPTTIGAFIKEEKRVEKAWPLAYAKSRGVVSAFIKARPSVLHNMPSIDDPAAGRSWPSRRTWEMACRAKASAEIQGLNASETDTFVQAFIGEAAYVEFVAYIASADLPAPDAVLDGAITWSPDPHRLDITVAVFASCSALLTSKGQSSDARLEKMWRLISNTFDATPDIAMHAATPLVAADLYNVSNAAGVLAKMRPFLKAAGLTV